VQKYLCVNRLLGAYRPYSHKDIFAHIAIKRQKYFFQEKFHFLLRSLIDSGSAVLRETFTPPPQKIDRKYKMCKALGTLFFLTCSILSPTFSTLCVLSLPYMHFLNIFSTFSCTFSKFCTFSQQFAHFLNILCSFSYFLNILCTFSYTSNYLHKYQIHIIFCDDFLISLLCYGAVVIIRSNTFKKHKTAFTQWFYYLARESRNPH